MNSTQRIDGGNMLHFLQVFGPLRARETLVSEIQRLVEDGQLPDEPENLTIGASDAFELRTTSLRDAAGKIFELDITHPGRYLAHRIRAQKFAAQANKYDYIHCVYIPGDISTVELDAFVRAVDKPVYIYALTGRK